MKLFKWFTKCNHPAKHLYVKRDETIERLDDLFDEIIYHLYCRKCGEQIDISYAKPTDKFYNYQNKDT